MGKERRIHPRLETGISAELRDAGGKPYTVRAKNLSRGGIGLELKRPIQENVEISVNLYLVFDGVEDLLTRYLDVTGKVIWVAPLDAGGFEAGIRFDPLNTAQERLLEHYLSTLTVEAP